MWFKLWSLENQFFVKGYIVLELTVARIFIMFIFQISSRKAVNVWIEYRLIVMGRAIFPLSNRSRRNGVHFLCQRVYMTYSIGRMRVASVTISGMGMSRIGTQSKVAQKCATCVSHDTQTVSHRVEFLSVSFFLKSINEKLIKVLCYQDQPFPIHEKIIRHFQ